MEKKSNKTIFRIVFLLLGFDLILILIHLLLQSESKLFHLDFERNIPTIYQSTKLILVSFFIFFHFIILTANKSLNLLQRTIWVLFGLMFLWLGIDEVGELHENFEVYFRDIFPEQNQSIINFLHANNFFSSKWIIFYSPMIIVGLVFFFFSLKYFLKELPKKVILTYILGFTCFILVPIFEFISTTPQIFETKLYNFFLIFEEFLELFGATLFLVAVLSLFVDDYWLIKKRLESKN